MIRLGYENNLKTIEYDLRKVNAELGAVGTRRTIEDYFCFSSILSRPAEFYAIIVKMEYTRFSSPGFFA